MKESITIKTAYASKTQQYFKHFAKKFSSDISYWIAAFLTGLIAVGYAELIHLAERFSQNLFIQHPLILLISIPTCFLASWGCVYLYAPEAKGSGIPQVMAAIESHENENNGPLLEKLLGMKTLIIKILSSTLCVLGGGAVGREGPTIQIAASVFHFVNRMTQKLSLSVNYHFGLIAGGAAGIAAAFNTPLGGLVFAIEELATSHFNKFKTSLISGVIISGLVSQSITGTYLYLGYPKLPSAKFEFVLWALCIGIITGSLGATFGKMLYFLTQQRGRITSPKKLAFIAAGCGFLLALLILFFDQRMAGPGREVVIQLLFKDSSAGDWRLALARFFAPLISYLSGGAGGIFAPALAAGGAIGAFLGNCFDPSDVNIFILIGMIGFLTGVTRTPFTSFVLVLEMTDRHSAIFPMMIAAISASLVAKLIEPHSFYEHIKQGYIIQNKR